MHIKLVAYFMWLYGLLQATINLVDSFGSFGSQGTIFSFLVSIWHLFLSVLSARILRMVTDKWPLCVLSLNLHFAWEWEKVKGRAEGREKGERGEKGKDEEEGCNYGLAHNLDVLKKVWIAVVRGAITVLGMEADDTKFLRFSSDLMSLNSPVKYMLNINVAVPGRNQTLFHCVFQSHYCVRSAELPLWVGLIRTV